MSTDGIPDNVRQIIFGRVTSVMQLEVLLFLAGHAGQTWTVSALVKHFLVDPSWVETEIGELCKHGFLRADDPSGSGELSYRYNPQTVELNQAVTGLIRAYAERRVTVTNLIYAKPIDNIRVFADAFRLRKG